MNLNDSGQFPMPVLPGGVLASSKCSHVLSAVCSAYKVTPEGEAFVKAPGQRRPPPSLYRGQKVT